MYMYTLIFNVCIHACTCTCNCSFTHTHAHTLSLSLSPLSFPPPPPLSSGLFLKALYEESPFGNQECPSDILFTLDGNGRVTRLNMGKLVVRNKALHGGRRSQRVYRTTSRMTRKTSAEKRELDEVGFFVP